MDLPKKSIKEIRKESQRFMTDGQFNDELKRHFEISRKIADDENKEKKDVGIVPKLFIISRKEEKGKKIAALVSFIGTDFNDGDTKRKMMFGLGAKMFDQKFDPIAIYLISEAWIARDSMTGKSILQKDEKGNILPPSEQPTKSEAMIVAGRTIDGREGLATICFKKAGGKIFFLDETKMIAPYDEKKNGNAYGSKSDLLAEFFKGYLMAFGVNLLKKDEKHGK